MLQFRVNNEPIDMLEDTNFQFVKSNILFAFDNVKAERTTNFKIPATAKNLRILEYSNKTYLYGEKMRRRLPATLIYQGIVKNGFLCIESYSDDFFNSIFITGELLGLYEFSRMGTAKDLKLETNASARFNVLEDNPTMSGDPPLFRVYSYSSWDGKHYPFYSLVGILEKIIALSSISIGTIPDRSACVILSKLNAVQPTAMTIYQSITDYTQPNDNCIYDERVYNSISTNIEVSALFNKKTYGFGQGEPTTQLGESWWFFPMFLQCRQDLEITFPSDWDDDLFLYGMRGGGGEMRFFGGREFDRTKTVTGASLKGRTVSFSTSDAFMIVNINDWSYVTGSGIPRSEGFRTMVGVSEVSGLTVQASKSKVTDYEIVYLRDNLPELTGVDICKIIAALSGTILYYENGVISFDELDTTTFAEYIPRGIISVSNLERKFADYAQKNIINYESGDSVTGVERIIMAYSLDNENIEIEKTLYTIPFSEGGINPLVGEGDGDTIVKVSGRTARIYRTSLKKNDNLQHILDESSSVVCKIKMPLYEFDNLHPKIKIYIDGSWWLWTDAKWSKGIAELNLSKI